MMIDNKKMNDMNEFKSSATKVNIMQILDSKFDINMQCSQSLIASVDKCL